MRVAVDARWMQRPPLGGVGRTLSNLVPLIAERVELVLLTDDRQPAVNAGVEEHALSVPPPGHAAVWLQWSVPRWLAKNSVDLFHCTWYGLPFRQPAPMVVTIHDLTFEHHPEWFGTGKRVVYRAQARHAARTARSVLTVSEYVRADIEGTYGVPSKRIYVAAPAIDPIFAPERRDSNRLKRLGISSPYLVALGGAPRRNLQSAVEAWRQVRRERPEINLVVAGPPQPVPVEPGLVVTPSIGDEDWSAVLAGAEALVYPTMDEGFGMPALEAVASGTPVICAPVGSLPEVLKDAALWSRTTEWEAIAEALKRLLSDRALRENLRNAGRAVAATAASWGQAANTTVAAYRAALDDGAKPDD